MKRLSLFLAIVGVFACFVATKSIAQIGGSPTQDLGNTSSDPAPRLIRYSGVLRDVAGQPRNGVVSLTLSLYKDQQGGNPIWVETQNVQVDGEGNYSVLMGATQSKGLPADLFTASEQRWLGVQVQLAGEVEQPRSLLTSVPYAVRATDAETLGGLPASAFLRASSSDGSSKAPSSSPTISSVAETGGTGTTNSITKWLNTTGRLGDSGIYEVGSFVGLGTASPSSALNIRNASNANFLLESLYAAGPQMTFKNAGPTSPQWVFGMPGSLNGTSFLIYDLASLTQPFTIEQGALQNSFYVNSAGFVGLGTSAPTSALHIRNTLNANFTLDAVYNAGPQMRFKNSGAGAPDWVFGIPGSPNGNSFFIYDLASLKQPFTLEKGAANNSFYVNAAGNVGVGTATPTARLDVSGTVRGTGFNGDGSALTNVGTAAIADGSIGNADINPAAAIAPTKIAGTAATLGANVFTGNQTFNANLNISGGITFPDATTLGSAIGLRIRGITYLGGCETCSVLTDADDQPMIYLNVVAPMTVNSVTCYSDAGTPTINLKRNSSGSNVLSGDLACSASGVTSTTFSGSENVLNLNDTLNFLMINAGGVAKRVTVSIKATVN